MFFSRIFDFAAFNVNYIILDENLKNCKNCYFTSQFLKTDNVLSLLNLLHIGKKNLILRN